MADFSAFLNTPQFDALTQHGLIQRAMHDGLLPAFLFRVGVDAEEWPINTGNSTFFTGKGLIKPKTKPIPSSGELQPSSYPFEQWMATIQPYGDSIDTDMPTTLTSAVDLFLHNAQQMGISAGQSMNRIVRNSMYNPALSGNTVAFGAQGPTTTLHVRRLNGFDTARRPDLPSGSAVAFQPVSSSNPLRVRIFDQTGPAEVLRNVIAVQPDIAGDFIGPGTLTLDSAVTVLDRAYVIAVDATNVINVGGGLRTDDINSSDLFSLSAIRAAVNRLRKMNVPKMPDGRYHCHFDPDSQGQIFADPEFQRLNRSLPDYEHYKDYVVANVLNVLFFEDNETPTALSVTTNPDGTYTSDDNFAGELFANGTTGVPIHRPIFQGFGGLKEYWQPQDKLVSEAGVTGKIGEFRVTNNNIEVDTDRIRLIFRAPLDRLQRQMATSWYFVGAWPFRTDAATGDAARYKRAVVVQHGE